MWQSPGILADQQLYRLTYFALLLFVVNNNAEDKTFVVVEGLEFEVMCDCLCGPVANTTGLTVQVNVAKLASMSLNRCKDMSYMGAAAFLSMHAIC